MKKNLLLTAALCLALALSACGQTPPADTSSDTSAGASPGASSGAASSQAPGEALPEPGRDAHAVLMMEVEGQTEEVPATLYEGEGYSIYIPDEGWTKVAGKLPKGAANQWVSDFNPEVTLTVCPNEVGANWAEMQKNAIVFDQKSEAGDVVFRTWTVYMAYPPEAEEGFGARLPVIAESFAFTPAP